jgi:hypothetical protein
LRLENTPNGKLLMINSYPVEERLRFLSLHIQKGSYIGVSSSADIMVARMVEGRKVYTLLVRKSERKGPLGRPRHRWEDGIRMHLGEIGWGCGADSVGSG